jgi:hypothetical protein
MQDISVDKNTLIGHIYIEKEDKIYLFGSELIVYDFSLE